jgi:hypothetical protein
VASNLVLSAATFVPSRWKNGRFKCGAVPLSTANPSVIARLVAGLFFPQRLLLKIGVNSYSPALLHKIVAAAAQVKSHDLAAKVLELVGEFSISGRHVNRLTEIIGTEMATQRDQATQDYVHHRRQSTTEPVPQVVSISLDGGRIQTRTSGLGVGVHQQHWKEDKVACLLTLQGETFTEDPHPEPPQCFLDAPTVDQLVRDMQAHHGKRQENELPQLAELSLGKETIQAATAAEAQQDTELEEPAWPPKRTKAARTCVATMQESAEFGKMVAAEAYRRNFKAAERGALLGDGGTWIWTLHHKWFSWLTPITDFVHPLTYLYVTATVLSASVSERWQLYVAWLTQVWQGRVREVLTELDTRLEALGPYPGTGPPPATDAREALRRTITYLQNNQERMNYADYRRQGLPVTSSAVESLIKEFNYRVKGTEKFWDNPEGAEAILQVRAAVLSDDNRLATHIQGRPGNAFRRQPKQGTGQAA